MQLTRATKELHSHASLTQCAFLKHSKASQIVEKTPMLTLQESKDKQCGALSGLEEL